MSKKKADTNENEILENVSDEQTEETQANDVNYEELLNKKEEATNDTYLRMMAEYDNFKRRTQKEKEAIYTDSVKDTVAKLLPVVDNLVRAVDAFADKQSDECKGVAMVLKQTEEIFNSIGVTEIKAVGEQFNPELHNAVMHIEDEKVDDNTVVEEFQKGYMYKDKVIRYSMVKVAN